MKRSWAILAATAALSAAAAAQTSETEDTRRPGFRQPETMLQGMNPGVGAVSSILRTEMTPRQKAEADKARLLEFYIGGEGGEVQLPQLAPTQMKIQVRLLKEAETPRWLSRPYWMPSEAPRSRRELSVEPTVPGRMELAPVQTGWLQQAGRRIGDLVSPEPRPTIAQEFSNVSVAPEPAIALVPCVDPVAPPVLPPLVGEEDQTVTPVQDAILEPGRDPGNVLPNPVPVAEPTAEPVPEPASLIALGAAAAALLRRRSKKS